MKIYSASKTQVLDRYVGKDAWIRVIDKVSFADSFNAYGKPLQVYYYIRIVSGSQGKYKVNIFNPVDDYAYEPDYWQNETYDITVSELQICKPLDVRKTDDFIGSSKVAPLREEFEELDKLYKDGDEE